MEISVKETEYCKIEAHYKADPEDVKNKRSEVISRFRNRKVAGFRKGKAPDHAVESSFKKEINDLLKKDLASKAYDDVLFDTKIKCIGYPQYSSLLLKDNSFECDLFMLKRPEFELQEYKNLEIPKPHIDKSVEEISEMMLQELRIKNGDIQPFEENDFVQMGDQLTLDFKFFIDSKEINGGSGEGVLYTVGQHSFPSFDDNILGMKAGETREFDLTLPSHFAEHADQTAHAVVTCHMGSRKIPCALDDTLATKVGLTNLAELNQKVGGVAAAKIQQAEKSQIVNQITIRLVNSNNFEIPSFLISAEVSSIINQQQINKETITEEQLENIKQLAVNNIKLALILEAIRDIEPEAVLSDSEAFNVLKQRISSLGENPESAISNFQQDGRFVLMMASMKNEFTLDWLVSQAKIIE